MATSSSTFSFKRLPWACITSILVIMLISAAFANSLAFQRFFFLFSEPSKSDPYRLHYLLNEAKNHNGKKIFLVGTSQSREGIDVRRLNQEFRNFGVTVYNFGVAAYSAIDFYMHVDHLIEANPTLIVYMPYAGNFYLDYDFKRLKYNYNPRVIPLLQEKLGKEILFQKIRYFFDAYLSDYFSLYKFRVELRPVLPNFAKYLTANLGKKPQVKYFHYSEPFAASYFQNQIKKYRGRKFYFSEFTPVEKRAFEKSVERIQKAGKELLIIDGPVNPKIEAVYENGVEHSYTHFIQNFSSRHSIPLIERRNQPDFDENDFIDFTHLNAEGRLRLTQFLGDYLKSNYHALFQENPI